MADRALIFGSRAFRSGSAAALAARASIVLIAALACSCCSRNPDRVSDGDAVAVEGRVRRVGNEPFSRLVISDEAGIDWYLDREASDLLRDREAQVVKVRAVVRIKHRRLADGRSLPDERELSNLTLR